MLFHSKWPDTRISWLLTLRCFQQRSFAGLAWKLRREEAELVVELVDDGDDRRVELDVEVEFAAEKTERRGKSSIPVEGCSIRARKGSRS